MKPDLYLLLAIKNAQGIFEAIKAMKVCPNKPETDNHIYLIKKTAYQVLTR